MNDEVIANIIGIGLTESQVNMLKHRGITVEVLFGIAANSDKSSMALYIHSLLVSHGDYDHIAGPMIDPHSGNNG